MSDSATSRRKFIIKIARIQRELNAPKNQFNGFGKYNYRSCEDIMQGLKPFLDDLIIFMNDEVVQIGDRYYVKATVTITDGEHEVTNSALAREALDKKGMDASQITGSCSSYARKYALAGMFLIDDNKDADSRDNRQHSQPQRHEQNNGYKKQPDAHYQQQVQPSPAPVAESRHNTHPTPATAARQTQTTSNNRSQANCGTGGKVLMPHQVKQLKEALNKAGIQEHEFLGMCKLERLGQLQSERFPKAISWIRDHSAGAA